MLVQDRLTGAMHDVPTMGAYGDPSIGEPYMGEPYFGEPYVGEPYYGDPYIAEPYLGEPYYGEPYMGEPYYGEPYMAEPERVAEPVYDGFGNPVGFAFLAPLAAKAAGALA